MRKIMMKFCEFLERKLYDEPTWRELAITLDRTRYRLYEAHSEIDHLQSIIKNMLK